MELFSTKKELLWGWCREKQEFSKIDVTRWGMENYHLRAVRDVQEWAEEGKLQRIPDSEKYRRGLIKMGGKNIAWWSV